jgi:serine/threonine-protein kinase RsbT
MEPAPGVKERHGVDEATSVIVGCDADIINARQRGRCYALGLGFSSPEATLVATAISELARNIVEYAERGEIVLRSLERDGRSGVLVIARDDGPGIPDRDQLDIDDGVAQRSDRLGLRGVKHLVDDLEVVSGTGRGTTVRVTKWRQEGNLAG